MSCLIWSLNTSLIAFDLLRPVSQKCTCRSLLSFQKHLGADMISAGAQLVELDLSDNAFGPNDGWPYFKFPEFSKKYA